MPTSNSMRTEKRLANSAFHTEALFVILYSEREMIVTIVRHGESTDNVKACWAGHADAPLSNHGMNQAKALGESFKSTSIDAIVSSDLKRAHWTAQQIALHHEAPLTVSPLLREQNFGIAERQPFGAVVRLPGRSFKFDQGESLDDVRARAEQVIDTFILPLGTHVVVVAHGIFNAELVSALLARGNVPSSRGGMTNTGWTRIDIDLPHVRVLCTDVTSHLEGVHRQKGGIGSQGYDSKQRNIRDFFAGK